MTKNFLTLKDFSEDEIIELLHLAEKLKVNKVGSRDLLTGKSIGLLFQKPSNRTRVSFDVGITQLGGNSIYLGPNEINLGVRESTADVSKTLSRYLDGIVARVNSHDDLDEMQKNADIPVINALSDLYHPCQALADLLTIYEKFEKLKGLTVSYIGDGNNVCNSLMIGCAKAGININIATPKGYEPNKKLADYTIKCAKEGHSKVIISNSPQEAVKGANVIYTDVWVSMGQEEETAARLAHFKGFQINKKLTQLAERDYIFMHCLPAHRSQEVTADVIDGENSVIFDQAENRLHAQKAVLIYTFERRER